MIESEAEYFDLVGDPLSFTHDTRLLSGLVSTSLNTQL